HVRRRPSLQPRHDPDVPPGGARASSRTPVSRDADLLVAARVVAVEEPGATGQDTPPAATGAARRPDFARSGLSSRGARVPDVRPAAAFLPAGPGRGGPRRRRAGPR